MWGYLDKLGSQVTRYSTIFGQFWYLLTFVFRMIVVAALGGSVYGDEKGGFICDTKIDQCGALCYNQFAKISHLRFWAFQLLAVTFPAVLFHFYSSFVAGQIEKLKQMRSAVEGEAGSAQATDDNSIAMVEMNERQRKIDKRERRVGKVRVKKVFNEGELKEIPITTKMKIAYYMSVILRALLEVLFIVIAAKLYDYGDLNCLGNTDAMNCPYDGVLSFAWMTVPVQYKCDHPSVYRACTQHFQFGHDGKPESGHVSCWISRPFEKSVFLRYMQLLAIICFFMCIGEILFIPAREFYHYSRSKTRQRRRAQMYYREEGFAAAHNRAFEHGGVGRSNATYPAFPGADYPPTSRRGDLHIPREYYYQASSGARRRAGESPPYQADGYAYDDGARKDRVTRHAIKRGFFASDDTNEKTFAAVQVEEPPALNRRSPTRSASLTIN